MAISPVGGVSNYIDQAPVQTNQVPTDQSQNLDNPDTKAAAANQRTAEKNPDIATEQARREEKPLNYEDGKGQLVDVMA